jgi:hypothetical protein
VRRLRLAPQLSLSLSLSPPARRACLAQVDRLVLVGECCKLGKDRAFRAERPQPRCRLHQRDHPPRHTHTRTHRGRQGALGSAPPTLPDPTYMERPRPRRRAQQHTRGHDGLCTQGRHKGGGVAGAIRRRAVPVRRARRRCSGRCCRARSPRGGTWPSPARGGQRGPGAAGCPRGTPAAAPTSSPAHAPPFHTEPTAPLPQHPRPSPCTSLCSLYRLCMPASHTQRERERHAHTGFAGIPGRGVWQEARLPDERGAIVHAQLAANVEALALAQCVPVCIASCCGRRQPGLPPLLYEPAPPRTPPRTLRACPGARAHPDTSPRTAPRAPPPGRPMRRRPYGRQPQPQAHRHTGTQAQRHTQAHTGTQAVHTQSTGTQSVCFAATFAVAQSGGRRG